MLGERLTLLRAEVVEALSVVGEDEARAGEDGSGAQEGELAAVPVDEAQEAIGEAAAV
jgi:hypothetical protein